LYLDRLYQWVFVRPYTRLSQVLWQQVDDGMVNRSIEATAIFLFSRYRQLAAFLWQGVDEGRLDAGLDQSARGMVSFSALLGLWTTGKLSLYLKMLFLGVTSLFSGLILYWYFR
jgi:NADH:ubiquinone oxidoreductase subunit 5 (subunit L)/multisubunit Na+/H+ antiporter MnhA subunit